MRKINFFRGIFSLAAVALAVAALPGGCSDDKIVYDNASGKQIAFRLQNGLPLTRATGTTADNVNVFVVSAQVYDNSASILPGTEGTLFDAQTVARIEGQANAFDYNPKRYYPDAAQTAHYAAYSPVTKNVIYGFKNNHGNAITYQVLPPDGAQGNTTQEDLLVAYTKVVGVVQPSGGTPVARADFDSPVLLNFKHALARVFVKAKNYNEEEVVIKALSLNNLYDQGVLDIDGKTWNSADAVDINEDYKSSPLSSTDDYKVLWQSDGSHSQTARYDYVLPPSGVSVAAKTVGAAQYVVGKGQGMLILPQTTPNDNTDAEVDDGDFYVEVTYSISNITSKTVRAAFTDLNGISGAGLTFEMGKQYALEVGFHGTAVTFDITVENWEVPEVPVVANTTVTFAANKPANASNTPSGIHDANSGFVLDEDLPTLSTAPTLTGWAFQGYYDAPVGGKLYYGSNLATDSRKWDKAGPAYTLYAQWKATTGSISIDASTNNGTNGSTTNITWTYDRPLPNLDPAGLPTKTGYNLTGLWSASADGAQYYAADGTYIYGKAYNESNNPTTLYAQFEGKTFTVTIDLQGGQYEGATHLSWTQQIGAAPAITLDNSKFSRPSATAKTFGGLFQNSNGTGDAYKNNGDWAWQTNFITSWTYGDGKDVILYAKWE